jgi:hypothetical protein
MLKQEQPTLKQNYFHFQIKSRCRSCCSGQTMDAKAKLAANAKTKTSAEVPLRTNWPRMPRKISAEVALKPFADTKAKKQMQMPPSAVMHSKSRSKAEAIAALKLVKMIM